MKTFNHVLTLFLSATAAVGAVKLPDVCLGGTSELVNTTLIEGKELTTHRCKQKETSAPPVSTFGSLLDRRNTANLCGAPCTTYCNSGSGGPDPNDCSALASTFSSTGGGMTLSPGFTYYWTLGSCQVYMNNNLQPARDIYYCFDYTNLPGVINYVAWNCQGTSGDKGGSCHFYDRTDISWIQVQTA